jgi:uncharacterized protein YciI
VPENTYYMLQYDYVSDVVSKRAPHRSAHLQLANEYKTKGKLILGGAFQDPIDSAAIVFRNVTQSEVEEFAKKDPYVINKIVTQYKIR